MQRHPFDPVSAALGALVIVLGLLVALDALDALGDANGSGGWWFTAAAAVVGLAILPWRRGRSAGDELDVPADEPVPDELSAGDVG
jgi:hypothetical protein